jgi:RNA polymerase sigma-70 factor (ECF subfamily)
MTMPLSDEQQSAFPCFALFRNQFGYIPNVFLAQSSAPELVMAQAELIANILLSQGSLSRVQKETVALLFAGMRQNEYCATLHYRNLQAAGISRETLDKILQHRPSEAVTRRTALLDLTIMLAVDPRSGPGYAACASSLWPLSAIQEVILTCALSAFLCELSARITHVPDFPPLELPSPARVEPPERNAPPFDGSTIDEAISRVVPEGLRRLRRKEAKSDSEVASAAALQQFLVTAQMLHPGPAISRPFEKDLKDPDRDMVTSAQQGDLTAFSQLIDRHGRTVYRTLIGLLENSDEALDAMQDTFLRAFQSLGSFQGRSKFLTWLLTIATNAGIQRLRERRPEESLDEAPEDIGTFRRRQLRAWTDTPEECYSKQERRELVESAVRRLPAKYRIVLIMRDIEQLSTEDAAAALQLSIPALKARLLRGRLMLRDTLSMHFGKEAEEVRL